MKKAKPIQLHIRINPNYKAMMRLSMDLKEMHRSRLDHKFILAVIDEVTHFIITIAIYQSGSEGIGDASIEHVFSKYSIPECMIIDQDSAFMSSLTNYLRSQALKLRKLPLITINLY